MSAIPKYRQKENRVKGFLRIAERGKPIDSDVLNYKLDLERANRELARANIALSVLARSIDKKSKELEDRIANYIRSKICPLVEEMCRDSISDQLRDKMLVLAAILENLTPSASKSHEVACKVSPAEFRIATLINKNCRTDEIARLLKLSPHTVKTHRRSLRKKLSIQNTKVNLSTFLKFKLGVD
jgi:DNA-binding NarL/FixJ family response regulator